ncbi:MAG: TonB-dependent receptor [Tannerella sp.]|jgi:outer membrane receptor for ferrienterochelin and colicin|nr:TonB-dependent receptor [Tannerella sp.]
MHIKQLVRMYVYAAIGACLVSFAAVQQAQAQEASDTVSARQLPDVEVVGRSRVPATKLSIPVQMLDARSIARLGTDDLSEAVKRFAGVTVRDYGGIGGLKTVSIRSLGAHHTAVSYDGVTVSDAQSGQIDISRFTLDNVEMVSLSTGQSEDIFRPARLFASAGALEIRTQKPEFEEDHHHKEDSSYREGRRYRMAVKLKSGSFGLFNPTLNGSCKISERWSASANVDYMQADSKYPYTLVNGKIKSVEKRLNSDITTARFEANLYGDLGKGGRIETKLYAFDSERGLPGAVILYDNTATERLWNDYSFIQSYYHNKFNNRWQMQARGKYSCSYSRYRDVSDKYAAGMQEDRNTQQEYYASAGVLFSAADCFSAALSTDYAFTELKNNFLNAPQPGRNTSLTVLAAKYQTPRLTGTISLLATYITDKIKTTNATAPATSAASTTSAPACKKLSPAASLSWQPLRNSSLRLRASYQNIFRLPTFTDLYYLRIGNYDLKPENAHQYNAGLAWSGSLEDILRYISFSADAYYNKVDNKIVARPTLYIWKMMNMGEVDIRGLDVNLAAEAPLRSGVSLAIAGNYTWQSAIDVSDPKAKNYRDQIPYTPRHTGNASLTVENPWVNVSYLLTVVGKRYDLPQNIGSNRIDGYAEQSISLNRSFVLRKLSVRLQGEILNIANTQYDVIHYYPMPGRSFRINIKTDF